MLDSLLQSSLSPIESVEKVEKVEGLWYKELSSQSSKKPKKCEVEMYLEEARLVVDETEFNLLTWWNAEPHKLPILARIARDLFAVPISTVASESSFSTGDRIIGPHCSRLRPETIEALMCLQNVANSKDFECAPIYEDEDVEVDE
ncbi:putative AC transposase [Bienertia sinuspersici]